MKNQTRIAIAAISLALVTPMHAAADTRKGNRGNNNNPSRQLEKGFDAIAKAVADARGQTAAAIKQRDAAIEALEDEKVASAKTAKQLETNLAESKLQADTAARELADTRQKLEKANQALAVQIKAISDAQKSAKAIEAKHAEAEKNLKSRDEELAKLRKEAKAANDRKSEKKKN